MDIDETVIVSDRDETQDFVEVFLLVRERPWPGGPLGDRRFLAIRGDSLDECQEKIDRLLRVPHVTLVPECQEPVQETAA